MPNILFRVKRICCRFHILLWRFPLFTALVHRPMHTNHTIQGRNHFCPSLSGPILINDSIEMAVCIILSLLKLVRTFVLYSSPLRWWHVVFRGSSVRHLFQANLSQFRCQILWRPFFQINMIRWYLGKCNNTLWGQPCMEVKGHQGHRGQRSSFDAITWGHIVRTKVVVFHPYWFLIRNTFWCPGKGLLNRHTLPHNKLNPVQILHTL